MRDTINIVKIFRSVFNYRYQSKGKQIKKNKNEQETNLSNMTWSLSSVGYLKTFGTFFLPSDSVEENLRTRKSSYNLGFH